MAANPPDDHSTTDKKVPKKVWYPFGSPPHTKIAFSEFAHLDGDVRLFAESLALATDVKPEIRGNDDDDSTVSSVKSGKKKAPKIKIDPAALKDFMAEESGGAAVDICPKKACQEIVVKILEFQSMNKFEREDLVADLERLSEEYNFIHSACDALESKLEVLMNDSFMLENTCKHLASKQAKLEKTKLDLIAEKDITNAKLMMLETEKAQANRENQELELELSRLLWGTSESENELHNSEDPFKSTMVIKQSLPDSVASLENVSKTPYNHLARGDVIDFLERPKNIPSLPIYLQEKLELSSLKSGKSMGYYSSNNSLSGKSIRSPTSGLSLSGSMGSGLSANSRSQGALFLDSYVKEKVWPTPAMSITSNLSTAKSRIASSSITGRLSPLSKTFQAQLSQDNGPANSEIKNIQRSSPHLHLPKDSFKGYTPTGSPAYRHRGLADVQGALSAQAMQMEAASGSFGDIDDGMNTVATGLSTIGMDSVQSGARKGIIGNKNHFLRYGGSSDAVADVLSQSPKLPIWTNLDPVFYNERARTAHLRGAGSGTLGKMRQIALDKQSRLSGRNAYSSGSLLTASHPGLDLRTNLSKN